MPNVFRPVLEADPEEPPGFRVSRDRVASRAGAQRLEASVYRLPPGEAVCPYHWHSRKEEMLVVIAGIPSVRTPEGWRDLRPGEVVAFPAGREGIHQVANRSGEDADVLLVAQWSDVDVCGYPDSGKVGIYGTASDGLFREGDTVDYYDGETAPDTMPPA